jgi:outer membrane protein assembly factor BamB
VSTTLFALLAALGAAPLAAPARSAAQETASSGLYRSLFERGLAELAAGANEDAAHSFRAAGELAPDAPVWKAYLSRALGEEPRTPDELNSDSRGSWELVPAFAAEARFDPTGERLISEQDPANLWDARTGERIAVLSHRATGRGWKWQFDQTGRVLIGLGRSSSNPRLSDTIDVRDARTGEPLTEAVIACSDLAFDTRFKWQPPGSRVEESTDRRSSQVVVAQGVLRWNRPNTRPNENYVLSPDGKRAVLVFRNVPNVLRLVDPATGSTLASIEPGGWTASFSDSGRFVASIGEQRILVLDAETGGRLLELPAPEKGHGRWRCSFAGEELALVESQGRVTFWDPATKQERRRFELRPPPIEEVYLVQFAAEGTRLIVDTYRSLIAYDTTSGEQVWNDARGRYDIGDAVSASGLRYVSGDEGFGACIRDTRTGAILAPLVSEPFKVIAKEMLAGEEACVVCASDGTLRRVDLATGTTTAVSNEHAGSTQVFLETLDEDRLVSWSPGGKLCLREATTLAPIQTVELAPHCTVAAVDPIGCRFVAVLPVHRIECWTIAAAPSKLEIDVGGQALRGATFSPDGSRLALLLEQRIRVLALKSAAVVADFELQAAPNPGPLAFHGADRLAVGWGDEERVGVDVFELPQGRRIARLDEGPCLMGGRISDLLCAPELGRIVYSVTSCGFVAACNDTTWRPAWTLDYGGGNPSSLDLHRSKDSRRVQVSGMSSNYARIVDLVSGEVLAKELVEGCFDLRATSDDAYIVGNTWNGLAVISGESFEPLYVRSEGAGGSGWIVREGKQLEVVGERGRDTSARHLERGGLSHPADGWDAWIVDPLGLVRAPLDVLPEPPRIRSGPPRVVLAEGDAQELSLGIESEDPLLGVQLEIEGRPMELVLLDRALENHRSTATFSVPGPWPLDLRLRAIARSGVLSSPWRVRIEPFR